MKRSSSGSLMSNAGDAPSWSGFLIYIYPKKISTAQRKLVTESCRRQGLRVADDISADVTHVITNADQQRVATELHDRLGSGKDVLTLSWLTSSLAAGRPLANDAFRDLESPSKRPADAATDEANSQDNPEPDFEDTNYACLSATPLTAVHPDNQKFVDALLSLEKARELTDYNTDQKGSRSLAFRRAACKLKIYPKPITSIKQIVNLDSIGRHSVQVVEEILREGVSKEVEDYKRNPRLQVIQIFSGVYGCGPAGAAKWYAAGARTIEDLRSGKYTLTDRQQVGLQYHNYLKVSVTSHEAEALRKLVEEEVQSLSPGMTATLAGGFRRGKHAGHDIDILLHHTTDNYETDFLQALTEKLRRKGLLVHSELLVGKNNASQLEKSVSSHYHRDTTFYQRTQKMDHLDKAYCMIDIPKELMLKYLTPSAASPSASQAESSTEQLTSPTAARAEEENEKGSTASTKSAAEADTLAEASLPEVPSQLQADPSSEQWWTTQEHFVRRVDLIVCPHKQWAYALVGWTGSKHFNRALRLYAMRTKQTILNSQTMYNQSTQQFIPAETEEDVFNHLGVPVFPPHLRNC